MINCWIALFSSLKAVILIKMAVHGPVDVILKESIGLVRLSLRYLNDRKLVNIWRLNMISTIYNYWALLYIKSLKEECINSLRKLTEMINKDIILVDSQILKRISLLKWYCHYKSDMVLSNHAAKMALDLENQEE